MFITEEELQIFKKTGAGRLHIVEKPSDPYERLQVSVGLRDPEA